jgi:hypothetical protein
VYSMKYKIVNELFHNVKFEGYIVIRGYDIMNFDILR